jgi:ribosomal protein S18 acetylase RimI-like enzyme
MQSHASATMESVPWVAAALSSRIEEAALNATVVREQMLYDGWLVRWAPAKARRARSINVIGPGRRELDEKLRFCADVYARAAQPLIFRLTSAGPDEALEGQLAARGFQRTDETCVMARSLPQAAPVSVRQTLRYEHADPARFAQVTGTLRDYAPRHVAEHAQRLASIAVPCVRLLASDETGNCVAAGMAVMDGDLVGIFDVVVRENARRRGYARQLAERLLGVGRDAGARAAYLQVEYANTAARSLYATLGFADQYAYWYRTHQHN